MEVRRYYFLNKYKKIFIGIFLFFCGTFFLNAKENFNKRFKSIPVIDEVAINNIKYVEIKANYDKFLSPEIVKLANNCYKKNLKWLKKAQKIYKINPKIIVAILTVESLCGNYHEKYNIVGVYKTLIRLNKDKKYQRKIFKIVKLKYPDISKKWFKKRILKKYKWAKKQLVALKKIYEKYKINVFNIKGSWAGAFGLPQFIPTTFLNYAVDGNKDGKINIDSFPDAIFSIANYLKKNGWNEKFSNKKKYKVILRYNNSKLYAETILKLAGKI